MIHARLDYQRIQDPSNKIKDDEPVFLLRAQDDLFIPMLLYYMLLANQNCLEAEKSKINLSLAGHIKRAMRWRANNAIGLPTIPFDSLRDKEG